MVASYTQNRPIHSRPFLDDQDFWALRDLSLKTYPSTGLGWNWDLRRWDGSRFYDSNPITPTEWSRTIRLWETEDGQLAGAVNGDGNGWFFLQMDPDYRDLEDEMFAWAEENLSAARSPTSPRIVQTEVYEYDVLRLRLAEQRGYQKMDDGSVVRRLRFGQRPLPEVVMAPGYILRTNRCGDMEDSQRLADLLNAAFRRSFHNAGEFYQFSRLAPSYEEDLNLVAEAPDGSFGAYVAAIYDRTNRRGLYEPVCTHPEHRRKRLAQTLMFECLHRLQAEGAREATVETGLDPAANALYDSIGFTEVFRSHAWQKILEPPLERPAGVQAGSR